MKRMFFIKLSITMFILFTSNAFAQLQSDTSDVVWSIVMPQTTARNIDMKQWIVGKVKDTLIEKYIINTGSYNFRVDSIFFTGKDSAAFRLGSDFPRYMLAAGVSKDSRFNFIPTRVGIHNAYLNIITQADTLKQSITGEGILPMLSIKNKLIDFGKVTVGEYKDKIAVFTIENVGNATLLISNTKHNLPNAVDFSTLDNTGGAFSLAPGAVKQMNLRFTANSEGLTNGTLDFEYNGIGSPAKISLLGEGIRMKPRISSSSPPIKHLLCADAVTDTLKIWNTRGDTLRISDIRIIGKDAVDFIITKNPAPAKISKLDTALLIYSFAPKTTGKKSVNIEITSNSSDTTKLLIPFDYNYDNISLQSVTEIDMGGIFISSVNDTTFTIKNTGSTTNKFILSSGNSAFTLTPTSIILNKSQSELIKIHYNGSLTKDEKLSFTISIIDTICGKSNTITVNADIWNNKKITLESGNAEAIANDTVIIPIFLRNGDFIKYTSITSINVDLTFNTTLLFPVDYIANSSVSNSERTIKLSLPTSQYSNGILANIVMVAALGNAPDTKLKLQNIKMIGGTAELDSLNGTFTLLGICDEGGKRLINPNGAIKIASITPNPSESHIDVELNLIENTGYKLLLFNSIGQLVREISRPISTKGSITEHVELSDLSYGLYNLILQTESERVSEIIMIMK